MEREASGTYLLCGILLVKLDKSILQTIPRFLIPDNFTTQDLAKSRKDQFEIFIRGDGIQFTHK